MSVSFTAPHALTFPYRRTVGPLLGRFFAALDEREILGVRAADGRVLVPPVEYDPESAAELTELVAVGPAGRVTAWAWVAEPRPHEPSVEPFAWALIQLDGADTPMVHAVAARSSDELSTGMRVVPRWTVEPTGDIHNIECFIAEAG